MWIFYLIGWVLYLALIVISVFAYPIICAIFLDSSEKKRIMTFFLMLLSIAIYLFACKYLETLFGNWCYALYTGILLTPLGLYSQADEKEDKSQYGRFTIPILTFITSSLFMIEGGLRMARSYSVYKLLKFGWGIPERLYYEKLHYVGVLLFLVSLISLVLIGISLYHLVKDYLHILKKKSLLKKATQKVREDSDLLMSFKSEQVDEAIQYYNTFCQKIIAALESSDEKSIYTFEYKAFNNIDTSYNVLCLSTSYKSFYFYPMGVVNDSDTVFCEYKPNESTTVSIERKQNNRIDALPNDVQPIRKFWYHPRPDPDMKIIKDIQVYVYDYDILSIANLNLRVFRLNAAEDVMRAYNKMYSYISQLKLQKQQNKMNVLLEKKGGIITENKEGITEANQLEDNKKAKQQVSIDNPKTLEECFIVIIRKHGIDIIKDSNLLSIVSSYNEVDISDYKNIFDGMVGDNFLNQFIDPKKQNDFTLFNLSTYYARQKKVNGQKALFITQALVNAIKKVKQ